MKIVQKKTYIINNISSSEEWEDVTESDIPPVRINFNVHHQTTGPQILSNIKEPIDYFWMLHLKKPPDIPVSTRIPLHLYKKLLDKVPETEMQKIKVKDLLSVISVDKPEMVLDYAVNIGGVDHADQYVSTYCFLQKLLKQWRKLFFCGLEMCVINSYIIYRTSEERKNKISITHYKFVKNLINQLRGYFRESESTSLPDNRPNNKLYILNVGERKWDCIVCSDRKTPGKRHQTTYYCECSGYICIITVIKNNYHHSTYTAVALSQQNACTITLVQVPYVIDSIVLHLPCGLIFSVKVTLWVVVEFGRILPNSFDERTQPRMRYKRSHDVDPDDSIDRDMRQSPKTFYGPDYKHHTLSDPLRAKDIVKVRTRSYGRKTADVSEKPDDDGDKMGPTEKCGRMEV
ncbi:hypothetical protein WN51_10980 [Melipona quadrifasciata]|uniref:PiggyBac transposable element-derived protein domain-containing protein n=1 Tax=Melipona quadrifasciata TaxID=166423 RepID=A0A0N1ISX4_9HYME|nr:hypothetical protein WN51_10980 [Melipona quadrifasciata]